MTSPPATRYADVLTLPGVPLTFTAALVGRSAYALVLLPLFYAVTDATGSVALGGTAIALYGATASFLAPVRAWLIDRLGARLMLTILVLLFGITLAGLASVTLLGGSGAALITLAAVAGAVAPPLGPTMRVAWGSLAPTPALLKKGLSFDSVVEELLYLVGPVIAGLGLAVIAPGQALFVPAALVIIGGLLFLATAAVGSMVPRDRAHPESIARRPLILEARFVGLLLPALVAGAVSGTLTVAVPVALAGHGGSVAAGIALGLFAGGSALGGLLYGALTIPGSAARQLVVLTAALLAASSVVAITTGSITLSIVLVIAGLFFSPVMIVAYVAAHAAGGETRQNSATTWVNTSHNLGGAAGSALAGVVIQAAGVPTAIGSTVAAAVVLLAVSAALSGRRPPSRS